MTERNISGGNPQNPKKSSQQTWFQRQLGLGIEKTFSCLKKLLLFRFKKNNVILAVNKKPTKKSLTYGNCVFTRLWRLWSAKILFFGESNYFVSKKNQFWTTMLFNIGSPWLGCGEKGKIRIFESTPSVKKQCVWWLKNKRRIGRHKHK